MWAGAGARRFASEEECSCSHPISVRKEWLQHVGDAHEPGLSRKSCKSWFNSTGFMKYMIWSVKIMPIARQYPYRQLKLSYKKTCWVPIRGALKPERSEKGRFRCRSGHRRSTSVIICHTLSWSAPLPPWCPPYTKWTALGTAAQTWPSQQGGVNGQYRWHLSQWTLEQCCANGLLN